VKINLTGKLLALLLSCGVIPLLVVSFLLIEVGRSHVRASVEQVHRLEADGGATDVGQFLQRMRNRLAMDLEGSVAFMSDSDIQATLVWMLGKQDNLVHIRMLRAHDDRGIPIGDVVRLPPESIPQDHRKAYLVLDDDVEEFSRHVPLVEAMKTGQVQVSQAYVNERRGEALVAMAVPVVDRLGQIQAVVTGELSLREIQRVVSDMKVGKQGFAYLVDATGRVIAHPQWDRVKRGDSMEQVPLVRQALASRQADTLAFKGEDGVDVLGAHAPVYWNGWQLLVQQPASDAFAPITDMIRRAGFILVIALVVALALGWLYVRSLVVPLREVMDGMRRIVDGQFTHRLAVTTRDEVGELAGAFNAMGKMLHSSRQEIESWNRELQSRVDAKTKQLESAQAQLVQSAKLASLGQLGAGVAHELNNPLTGVVGQVALLKRRLEKLDVSEAEREKLLGYVTLVQGEAGRCREIVHGLLSLSQSPHVGTDRVDVNDLINRFLLLVQTNMRSAGIQVVSELDPDAPVVDANAQQIQQVLMHLTSNAQQAMPSGGVLSIRTSGTGEGLMIEVSDTGRGIPKEHLGRIFDPFFTTKDDWKSPGLGLSVCYSILESHGGTIEASSEVGHGTTFSIRLPSRDARRAEAHQIEQEPVGLRRGRTPVGAKA